MESRWALNVAYLGISDYRVTRAAKLLGPIPHYGEYQSNLVIGRYALRFSLDIDVGYTPTGFALHRGKHFPYGQTVESDSVAGWVRPG